MEERNDEIIRLKSLFDSFTPYLFADERQKSFTKKWPHKIANLSPKNMAEAGFYYLPDPYDCGCVKCPFCLKELSGWENDDDPIEEHRRYKERCYFARLNKPEKDFTVRDVLLLLTNTRAAVLEEEAYGTLDHIEKAYELMVEKTEHQLGKVMKETGTGAASATSKRPRKRKVK